MNTDGGSAAGVDCDVGDDVILLEQWISYVR